MQEIPFPERLTSLAVRFKSRVTESGKAEAMRHQHPALESAINNLGHRGLDRVPAYGAEGFARAVVLSVAALNIHRISLLLRR